MAEVKKEEKRPMLIDPKEWALIRSMYFEDRYPTNFDIDPLERLDRINQGKQRNQAR